MIELNVLRHMLFLAAEVSLPSQRQETWNVSVSQRALAK